MSSVGQDVGQSKETSLLGPYATYVSTILLVYTVLLMNCIWVFGRLRLAFSMTAKGAKSE